MQFLIQFEQSNLLFHLVTDSQNSWTLFQYQLNRFEHKQKIRQPGEPVHSKFQFENKNDIQPVQFLISAPKEAGVKNLSFDIDNFKKVELPITIPAGAHLKYSGGNLATIYNKYWQELETVKIDSKKFEIGQGDHSLIFDCEFENQTDNPIKMELKTKNQGEQIKL